MKHTKCAILAFLLLIPIELFAKGQNASSISGNSLLLGWKAVQKYEAGEWNKMDIDEVYNFGVFRGFFEAAIPAIQVINGWELPPGVTMGQVFKVVGKYLEEHPEVLHESAMKLIATALFQAFPKKR